MINAIKKNGNYFNVATTTTALIVLCNLSCSMATMPVSMEYKPYSSIIDLNFTKSSNESLTSISNDYFDISTTREKIWNIFGETRAMTDDEQKVYNSILKSDAKKTGIRLF